MLCSHISYLSLMQVEMSQNLQMNTEKSDTVEIFIIWGVLCDLRSRISRIFRKEFIQSLSTLTKSEAGLQEYPMRLSCCCKLVRNAGVILFVGRYKYVSVYKNGRVDRSCLNTGKRKYLTNTKSTLTVGYLICEPVLYVFTLYLVRLGN